VSTDLPAIGISMFSTDRCIHPTELATESKHGASHRFICPNTATFRPRGPRPGTSVTLVAQHDPIWLAKQFATLDHLNGGRVVMGVGFGWNVAQAEHHGLDFRRRRQRSTSKRCARCGPHTKQPTRAGSYS